LTETSRLNFVGVVVVAAMGVVGVVGAADDEEGDDIQLE
jgi:hypothetical protein